MNNGERNELVLDNINLVHKALHSLGVGFNEDYFQEGCLHLMRCIDNYDASKGYTFSTYAYKNIRYGIIEYMKTDGVIRSRIIDGKRKYATVHSLDYCFNDDSNIDKEINLYDIIPNTQKDDFEFRLEIESYLDQLIKEGSITKEQKIIVLYKLDGYTDLEISQKLNKTQIYINFEKLDAFELLRIVINNESYN